MNSSGLFHLLRPYAVQPLPVRSRAYLRFYRHVRRDGLVASCSSRKGLTMSSRRRYVKKDGASTEDDSLATSSHAVSARIQELNAANALVYPRIQTCENHMRVPAFREKYKDVSADSPDQEEVVLRGMQNHNPYDRPAHDIQGAYNPCVGQVRSWCFWI